MLDEIMRRKMVVACVGIALIIAAALAYEDGSNALQGRDRGPNYAGIAKAVPRVMAPDWFAAQAAILRYQKDPARNRGWVLTPDGVFMIDFNSRRTVMHVPLPDWHWAGEPYGCTPALALGP